MSKDVSESFCKDIIKLLDSGKLSRPVYVIQEHYATRHHWDLRLEFDNVLKSWALPKSPPIKVGEKRLAVSVNDHPIEYALFEGKIPKGNYGAGTVKIWDLGIFSLKECGKKKIIVNIEGKKLKGAYCLLHFKPSEPNWLFFKLKEL